jgi:hypothetical protein
MKNKTFIQWLKGSKRNLNTLIFQLVFASIFLGAIIYHKDEFSEAWFGFSIGFIIFVAVVCVLRVKSIYETLKRLNKL